MKFLAMLLVGKPVTILIVAMIFFAGFLAWQAAVPESDRRPRWLLFSAVTWGLYAAWEWLVQIKTPEANIRVDLLLIWPLLAVVSAWSLFRTFRR